MDFTSIFVYPFLLLLPRLLRTFILFSLSHAYRFFFFFFPFFFFFFSLLCNGFASPRTSHRTPWPPCSCLAPSNNQCADH